jgi:hypothetical protein
MSITTGALANRHRWDHTRRLLGLTTTFMVSAAIYALLDNTVGVALSFAVGAFVTLRAGSETRSRVADQDVRAERALRRRLAAAGVSVPPDSKREIGAFVASLLLIATVCAGALAISETMVWGNGQTADSLTKASVIGGIALVLLLRGLASTVIADLDAMTSADLVWLRHLNDVRLRTSHGENEVQAAA